MKVCIIGASGKLGQYMIQHCLDKDYDVIGVCREQSVEKLDRFKNQIQIVPGRTNDSNVIKTAAEGCDAILTVLVPWGVSNYSSGTAKAVLDHAKKDARLVFSCGWHISKDGKDKYGWQIKYLVPIAAFVARLFRLVDIDDQVRATDLIFSSNSKWTVVRGSDLEEGPSEGLPLWAEHVGDKTLTRNLTRRIDFALFMVEALANDDLIGKAPAIVGQGPS